MKKIFVILLLLVLIGCTNEHLILPRESKIPTDAEKLTPEMDLHPPILHSDEFENPVPLAIVNTAGGEDSPFIPADRDEFYFFFTPDVSIPVEKQVIDGVTGMYVSKFVDGVLGEPERVVLQASGKLSLDGCQFVSGDKMWFCTAREGYTGVHWATALWKNGRWSDWKVDDFDPSYDVGELHIFEDEVYYHSAKKGGKGMLDIWVLEEGVSTNVEAVNSEENEGWPYLTPDGSELWFNRRYLGTPAVFRSKKIDGEWQEPEMIVSQFAGEPTLDKQGNLYFVHHYYKDSVMLEADIYVAYRLPN